MFSIAFFSIWLVCVYLLLKTPAKNNLKSLEAKVSTLMEKQRVHDFLFNGVDILVIEDTNLGFERLNAIKEFSKKNNIDLIYKDRAYCPDGQRFDLKKGESNMKDRFDVTLDDFKENTKEQFNDEFIYIHPNQDLQATDGLSNIVSASSPIFFYNGKPFWFVGINPKVNIPCNLLNGFLTGETVLTRIDVRSLFFSTTMSYSNSLADSFDEPPFCFVLVYNGFSIGEMNYHKQSEHKPPIFSLHKRTLWANEYKATNINGSRLFHKIKNYRYQLNNLIYGFDMEIFEPLGVSVSIMFSNKHNIKEVLNLSGDQPMYVPNLTF